MNNIQDIKSPLSAPAITEAVPQGNVPPPAIPMNERRPVWSRINGRFIQWHYLDIMIEDAGGGQGKEEIRAAPHVMISKEAEKRKAPEDQVFQKIKIENKADEPSTSEANDYIVLEKRTKDAKEEFRLPPELYSASVPYVDPTSSSSSDNDDMIKLASLESSEGLETLAVKDIDVEERKVFVDKHRFIDLIWKLDDEHNLPPEPLSGAETTDVGQKWWFMEANGFEDGDNDEYRLPPEPQASAF